MAATSGRVPVRPVPIMLDRRRAQQFDDAERDRSIAPVGRCFCDPGRCSFRLTPSPRAFATLADVRK
jgi:hypothetical protein